MRNILQRLSMRRLFFWKAESSSHSSGRPEEIHHDLTGYITKDEDRPVTRGGFGEVWKCTYQAGAIPIKVAVKALLLYTSDQVGGTIDKKSQRIQHELKIWARLNHRNIQPLYGYTYGFGQLMAIVSPWAENGNLGIYLQRERDSLTVVKRFRLLKNIADGLQYLHANNVIHGDLTGPNILILADGTACLTDFGLSLMHTEDVDISSVAWTSTFHGNYPWLAPELLGKENEPPVRPSKHSDIYSFGGIMLQILTSKIPYYYLQEPAIILCIHEGKKPERWRYPVFSDQYWRFMEQCWSGASHDRPSTETVVKMIRDVLKSPLEVSNVEAISDASVPPEEVLRDLTGYINKTNIYPIGRGGCGEIWKCIYRTDQGLVDVAVKSLQVYPSDQASERLIETSKRIRRELTILAKLKHRNILPLYGYTYGYGRWIAMVNLWAENGNLTTYLERGDTAITIVKQFKILADVAVGLQYLHTNNVIHGHLVAPNILIHGDGTACIADPGLALMHSEVAGISAASRTSKTQGGDFRSVAPELLGNLSDNVAVRSTEYSDIYSFGGIILQVLTGKLPYYYLRDTAVIWFIFKKEKPDRSRYPEVSDKYWNLIEHCWSSAPEDRPKAGSVAEVIMDELESLS